MTPPAEWVEDVIHLLRKVAKHWEGTDAPIGIEARRLLESVPADEIRGES